ncbi:MAG: hypothetical protein ACRC2R_00070 [Xenococcaceae cyanobacterium]
MFIRFNGQAGSPALYPLRHWSGQGVLTEEDVEKLAFNQLRNDVCQLPNANLRYSVGLYLHSISTHYREG